MKVGDHTCDLSASTDFQAKMESVRDVPNRNNDRNSVSEIPTGWMLLVLALNASMGWKKKANIKKVYCLRKMKTE